MVQLGLHKVIFETCSEGGPCSVGGISAVADEATHSYPHCFFVKCHSTFSTLGVIAVGEVALNVVHPGWRMGSISAVADEAAHCSQRRLCERCHGLTMFYFGGWVASPR